MAFDKDVWGESLDSIDLEDELGFDFSAEFTAKFSTGSCDLSIDFDSSASFYGEKLTLIWFLLLPCLSLILVIFGCDD